MLAHTRQLTLLRHLHLAEFVDHLLLHEQIVVALRHLAQTVDVLFARLRVVQSLVGVELFPRCASQRLVPCAFSLESALAAQIPTVYQPLVVVSLCPVKACALLPDPRRNLSQCQIAVAAGKDLAGHVQLLDVALSSFSGLHEVLAKVVEPLRKLADQVVRLVCFQRGVEAAQPGCLTAGASGSADDVAVVQQLAVAVHLHVQVRAGAGASIPRQRNLLALHHLRALGKIGGDLAQVGVAGHGAVAVANIQVLAVAFWVPADVLHMPVGHRLERCTGRHTDINAVVRTNHALVHRVGSSLGYAAGNFEVAVERAAVLRCNALGAVCQSVAQQALRTDLEGVLFLDLVDLGAADPGRSVGIINAEIAMKLWQARTPAAYLQLRGLSVRLGLALVVSAKFSQPFLTIRVDLGRPG